MFPRQQLYHGQSSRSYQCDSCAIVISFHQLTETAVSTITIDSHVLGRKNIAQHKKKRDFPSHLSCAVVPRVARTGNGNDGFLPGSALKAGYEGRCHGRAMFLSFHQALCNVWFTASPPCCFICDLVFPGQMAIGCLTCPLCSNRTVRGKEKKSDTGALQATIGTLHISVSDAEQSSQTLVLQWKFKSCMITYWIIALFTQMHRHINNTLLL